MWTLDHGCYRRRGWAVNTGSPVRESPVRETLDVTFTIMVHVLTGLSAYRLAPKILAGSYKSWSPLVFLLLLVNNVKQ